MTTEPIQQRVIDVIRDHFDDPNLRIDRATAAEDVPQWDSLSHVALIFRLEEALGVRFQGDEIADLADVGELIDLVAAKLAR